LALGRILSRGGVLSLAFGLAIGYRLVIGCRLVRHSTNIDQRSAIEGCSSASPRVVFKAIKGIFGRVLGRSMLFS